MLLSEGQMSDYKGAALMLTALPDARDRLDDKGSMQIGFARLSPNAASPSASRQNPIAKNRSNMTARFTVSVTRSRICLAGLTRRNPQINSPGFVA